jgi:hypothetical protein
MQHCSNNLHRLLLIGQEQCMRPAHRAGWRVALLDERLEQPALVLPQLDDIVLGHDSLLS